MSTAATSAEVNLDDLMLEEAVLDAVVKLKVDRPDLFPIINHPLFLYFIRRLSARRAFLHHVRLIVLCMIPLSLFILPFVAFFMPEFLVFLALHLCLVLWPVLYHRLVGRRLRVPGSPFDLIGGELDQRQAIWLSGLGHRDFIKLLQAYCYVEASWIKMRTDYWFKLPILLLMLATIASAWLAGERNMTIFLFMFLYLVQTLAGAPAMAALFGIYRAGLIWGVSLRRAQQIKNRVPAFGWLLGVAALLLYLSVIFAFVRLDAAMIPIIALWLLLMLLFDTGQGDHMIRRIVTIMIVNPERYESHMTGAR